MKCEIFRMTKTKNQELADTVAVQNQQIAEMQPKVSYYMNKIRIF